MQYHAKLLKGMWLPKLVIMIWYDEEALTMFTSKEYEEEYGLFLYNATWILDNYISKRTSLMFVLL